MGHAGDEAGGIETAARAFASLWGTEDLYSEIGSALTCDEADALARLLRTLDELDAEKALLEWHGRSDVDPEDRHRRPDKAPAEER